jgi:hypothetical protein
VKDHAVAWSGLHPGEVVIAVPDGVVFEHELDT